jgi:hypothetical protein
MSVVPISHQSGRVPHVTLPMMSEEVGCLDESLECSTPGALESVVSTAATLGNQNLHPVSAKSTETRVEQPLASD